MSKNYDIKNTRAELAGAYLEHTEKLFLFIPLEDSFA